MYAIGSRVSIPINGVDVPGIVVGSPMTEQAQRISRTTGQPSTYTVVRQDVLSLRVNQTTGEQYLTISPENTYFLWERDELVKNLDVDAKGATLTIADLQRKRKEDFLAQQRRRAESGTTFAAADLA